MNKQEFINEIAERVIRHAPSYGIKVYSPIIAQAILESGCGRSELAQQANNFFGLKYKEGRCPTASGVYHKIGSEQNADGTYTASAMKWCRFDDMEACVIGYFDFINNARYAGLKGVTEPFEYLQKIKQAGYATSINYVDNLMNVIKNNDLTRFDGKEEKRMLIAIDAGHGLKTAGKRCMKAIDPLQTREWILNDRIADRVQTLLQVYECDTMRVDDTTGAYDIPLKERVKTANDAEADYIIHVHHNAGLHGRKGGGTVVYYYSPNPLRKEQAQRLYNFITNKTKLYGNRSERVIKKGFYVLKHTKMPALLIENGFMDSWTDVPIILSPEHAEKTAQGIVAFLAKELKLKKKSDSNSQTQAQEPTTTKPTASKKAKNKAKSYDKLYAGTYRTTTGLNVREGAGTKHAVMVTIPNGTEVKCYGYYTSNLGTKWLYITFMYKGVQYTGFASAKYLRT